MFNTPLRVLTKTIFTAALVLASALSAPPVFAQEEFFELAPGSDGWVVEVLTTADGLPQNTVNDLVQTRDGYVWIATFGGLARYDGRRFRTFEVSTEPAMPEARVISLEEDRDGVLWVGFQRGHVARYVDGRFETVAGTGPETGIIWDFAASPTGEMWTAGSQGLGVVRDGAFRLVRFADGALGTEARALVASDDGFWASFGSEVLRFIDWNGEVLRAVAIPPSVGLVSRAVEDGRGGLVLATEKGAFSFDGSAFTPLRTGLAGDVIARPDGSVWVLSDHIEAIRLGRDDTATTHDPPRLTSFFRIIRTFTDREGGVWLGTLGGGVVRIRQTPLRWTAVAEGGLNPGVNAAVSDSLGNTWAVSCQTALRISDSNPAPIPFPQRPGECMAQLALDEDGIPWLAGPLARIVGDRLDPASYPPGSGPARLFTHADGSIGIVRRGSIYRRAGDEWVAVGSVAMLPGEALNAPLATAADSIWLPSSEGLILWTPEGTRRFGEGDGLAAGEIRALARDDDGNVWVGSYGGGLSRVTPSGSVQTLTTDDGLAENVIVGLVFDHDGHLWASGNKSLSVLAVSAVDRRMDGGPTRVLPIVFGPEDGFREGNGYVASIDANGRLWFPAIDGIVSVDTDGLWAQEGSPTLVIENVQADGTLVPLSDLRISSRIRDVTVEYTSPRFTRTDNLHFRYRLLELDPTWTEAGNSRTALFSRLRPGRYTFQVEVVNAETNARTLAMASLRITPSFWETLWFWGLAALLLTSALVLGVRFRLRAVTQRAVELETHANELRHEIDERVRAEAEREELREQLLRSRKLEAVGRLTGGIAHDFNNLLAVIMGHLDLATLTRNLPEGLKRHIDSAYKAAKRGGALTRQLLAFSRRSDLSPAPTDVQSLIRSMEPLLRPALGALTNLEVRAVAGSWSCQVDPGRLENVILNLAINARDALPGGGTVIVGLDNVSVDAVRAREWEIEPGDYLHLTVTDEGEGIAPEILGNVLDPFFTTKEVGKGTGLGLSMAYGFVRQSRGHLWIESVLGQGTTVHLYLPRAEGERVAAGPESTSAPVGRGERVLVIEDDSAVRAVTLHTLHDLGYRTAEAGDVAAARDALLHFPDVQLVLSDVVLPGERGDRFREELRSTRPDLPVILMSGRADVGGSGDGTGWGDILAKPFTRQELSARIVSALATKAG